MTTQHAISKAKHTSRTLRYRLLCLKRSDGACAYYVQIKLDGEQRTGRLSSRDHDQALALYRKIKHGRVTPCTLMDVLEDMQ